LGFLLNIRGLLSVFSSNATSIMAFSVGCSESTIPYNVQSYLY